ncbi:MAG: L,D-transpeptidase [Cycloclasticus sp.]|nr:MAG: L,D-transpeptidase [Cycloclasticus sp.]
MTEQPATTISIDINQQILSLFVAGEQVITYPVCTAKNGVGEAFGSECTPRGRHIIRAKMGDDAEVASVFVGRRLTGEIHQQSLTDAEPDKDWILSRILWLSGLEKGKNRLGQVDTMRRYIYIHGAPDELVSATPSSHGCIRMKNADVIDLYKRVSVGTVVSINE